MPRSARFRVLTQNALITLALLLLAAALGLIFRALSLQEMNLYALFLLGSLLTAALTASRACGAVSALCGVLLFEMLQAGQGMSLAMLRQLHPLDFLIPVSVTLLMGSLARKSRRLTDSTRLMLRADQRFLQASGPEEILIITAQQLQRLLGRPVTLYLTQDGALLPPRRFGEAAEGTPLEETAAQWTFQNGENSGARTARYARADYLYTCLRTGAHVCGVLGIFAGERPLTALENQFMQSVLSECTLALERDFSNREKQEAALQMRNEKLRADLLRSISHDLRTPLTSISGSAGLLAAQGERLSREQRQQLYKDIEGDALFLLGTVENLLSVTRIEEGRMALHLKPELLSEVVGETLRRLEKYGRTHPLRAEQEDELLLARIDAHLILQVLTNLVDNAVKYTPPGTEIVIRTLRLHNMAAVQVADTGPGIPDAQKAKVFDMFYSGGGGDARRGMGLGLALCKSIVTAHGGTLSVSDNAPHGAVFTFTLQEERIDLP